MCLFCQKPYKKITRHLEQVHGEEPQVRVIVEMDVKSQKIERRVAWEQLRNLGNFQHNHRVYQSMGPTDQLVSKRKSTDLTSPDSSSMLRACPWCKAFLHKDWLHKHRRNCHMAPAENTTHAEYRAQSRALLPVHASELDPAFVQRVLSTLSDDEVGRLVRSEPLILRFGYNKFKKTEREEHIGNVISSKMREIARLVLVGRKTQSGLEYMEDFIKPGNFRKVVECVKEMTDYNSESGMYRTPTVVLSLGHTLKKIAKIYHTNGIIENDFAKMRTGDDFVKLYKANWDHEVSSMALKTYYKKKSFNIRLLPLVKDVEKLYEHIKQNARNAQDYDSRIKYTQCYILMFNRKRGGEIQRLKKVDVANAYKSQEVDEEVMKTLTDVEKQLVKTTSRIEITGKRGRVALLLTNHMVELLEQICKENEHVPSQYVFSRMSTASQRPYRSSDLLRKIVKEVPELEAPDRMTWTTLRHHLASMAQVYAITQGEEDLLAQYMGHDIRIHRRYYRLPMAVLQRGFVCGLLHKNVGKWK